MVFKLIHRSFSILFLFCLFSPVVAQTSDNSLPAPFPVADAAAIAVSPDGSLILCAGKALTLYSLSGKKIWSESLPGDNYTLISFFPKEIVFVRAGTRDVQFRSFEGKHLPGFKTKRDIVSLAVSRDGSLIATGEHEFGLTLWDRQGHGIRSFSGLTDEAGSLVFSPDGKTLASGGSWWSKSDAEIILWAVDGSGRLVLEEKQRSGIHLEYTSGGEYLLSGSFQENKLILWDKSGKPQHTYSRNMEFGNQFIICGDYIASIKRDDLDSLSPGIIQVWGIDGTFLDACSFSGETCYSLAAIPGKPCIVSGCINLSSGDCTLRFMDLGSYKHIVKRDQQGRVIFNLKDYIPEAVFVPLPAIPLKPGTLPAGSFSSLAFSPDEKWGVCIGYDKKPELHLFRLTGEFLKTLNVDSAFLDDAFFSPSGQRYLVLGERLSLWSAGGELLVSLPQEYLCAAFLKDDSFIAGTYIRGTSPGETRGLIHFFDREGKKIREPVQTGEPCYRINADPQGKLFLCHGEQRIFLFRGDGTLLNVVEGFSGKLNYCTFLGSREEILVFYDFGFGDTSWCGVYDYTGKFLRRFKLADRDSPLRLAVSPDGSYIACRFVNGITVYSAFGTVIAGNLPTGESMESALRFSPGGKYLGCTGYSTGEVLPISIWEVK